MRVYLVRHGVAVDRTDPNSPAKDADRPLTPKGLKKTQAAALGMRALNIEPDAVLTSPWLRALQTAEIVCEVLHFPSNKIVHSDALKGTSDPAELFRELAKMRAKEIMCVGHEPHLHLAIALVLHASGPVVDLKKAGMAALELEKISPPHGQLLAVYPAKALRALANGKG